MATGLEAVVEIPLKPRRRGLLTQAATQVPSGARWKAGLVVYPWGSDGFSSGAVNYCDYDAEAPIGPFEPDDDLDLVFDPFEIFATEECSARNVSITDLNGRLSERWTVMVSEQIAAHLNGLLAARSTVVQAGVLNAHEAIANAEEWLANTLHGGEGMIHMSPAALSIIAEEVLVFEDGEWWTPSGHRVVADAGHTGDAPTGESSDPGTEWIYATGQVLYAVDRNESPDAAGEYLDRSNNLITARIVGQSVVAFDPSSAGAIWFGYPSYTPGGS